MLFRETVAIYCENRTEHTNTLCVQNAEFLYVKAGDTYSITPKFNENKNPSTPRDQGLPVTS
jgi:hypothetical protein